MKYELSDNLNLGRKEKKRIDGFLDRFRGWFGIGVINGAIIIGVLLLYYFLK